MKINKTELPKINPNQPIAIDLETCDPELKSLAPGYITGIGFVAGFAIAAEEGSYYIPVNHAEGDNFDEQEVIEWLNPILSADTDKIFHNAQYDLGWLKYVGVQVHGRIFDIMLAAALLDENRRAYSLDTVGMDYLGEGKNEVALEAAVRAKFGDTKTRKAIIRVKEDRSKFSSKAWNYAPFQKAKERVSQLFDLYPDHIKAHYDVVGRIASARGQELYKVPLKSAQNIKGLLWAVDAASMGSYPIQDVDLTYRLYKHFLPLLSAENLNKVMQLENDLLPCLLEMREQGVKIDMDGAVDLDIRYSKELQDLHQHLDTMAGRHIDENIDDDLIYLCDKLGVEYAKTAKGNPCFSAEKIPKHECFDTLLKIRKLNKARDTYIRGYFFQMSWNGRLHGQYNQLKSDEGGTVTGRLSSSNPNLQNIPAHGDLGHEMRELFIPDTDDENWLCMDFSGQEPKMLCNLVLMLDRKYGTTARKNLATGEIEYEREEGFPGANLARQPEFSGRKADFHTAVARCCMIVENKHNGVTVTDEELASQAKGFRTKAKSIGLGVMYGSGDAKVAEEMTKKGAPMTKEEAGKLRASIYEGVPFLDAVNRYVMDIAKRRGYVMTLLKRRGRFDTWEIPMYGVSRDKYEPLLFKSQRAAQDWLKTDDCAKLAARYPEGQLGRPQRAFTYKALNKIIQGSSADQTKSAMLQIYTRGSNCNTLDVYYRRSDIVPPKMRAQVHDELNFSIDKTEDVNWFQHTMENSIPLEVESVAEPGLGHNWAEAK